MWKFPLGALGDCLADRSWAADARIGSLSPIAWLVHRGELLRRDAVQLVRSARLCRDHEPVGSSLAGGRIRTDHVQTLARIQRHREPLFAAHVETLVDAAESVDTTSFQTVARRWAAYVDDHIDTRNDPPESWLDVATTLNGTVRLAGLLDPEGGAALLAALAALEEPPDRGNTRPASARRADALIALARGATTQTHLDVVVDLGRRSRVISPKLRRALVARDGGCAIAGCDRPHQWCDAHHIVHWADGGATDLDNLVMLCRRHHTQVHEHHGRLVRGPHGYTIEPP